MIRSTLDSFRRGLRKSRESFVGRLTSLFSGKVRLDAETLDQLEELLISADMGVASSLQITRNIERRLKEAGGEASPQGVLAVIREDVKTILANARPRISPPDWQEGESDAAGGRSGGKKKKRKKQGKGGQTMAGAAAATTAPAGTPHVVFVVGVNGTGKTTSIAKLAAHFQRQGRSVLLAAADTFRAAGVEQLQVWADRIGAECIHQGQGADPAAVVYDALSAAEARGHDLVIVDTAGRLHTKTNLMAELGKVARVITKKTGRPPETLLVVDANTGQNGLTQARIFAETIPVEGLILTKLDGTAKGRIVVAIAETLGLPVKYVGMGETVADLAEFDVELFTEALFAEWRDAEEEG